MGKLRIASEEDMIIKPKPTHWASYTVPKNLGVEGHGALFNGTQDQAVATLIQFARDFGQQEGFECGMGKREEMN